jgi:hypothetical protein
MATERLATSVMTWIRVSMLLGSHGTSATMIEKTGVRPEARVDVADLGAGIDQSDAGGLDGGSRPGLAVDVSDGGRGDELRFPELRPPSCDSDDVRAPPLTSGLQRVEVRGIEPLASTVRWNDGRISANVGGPSWLLKGSFRYGLDLCE